jgi:hypothetical protein
MRLFDNFFLKITIFIGFIFASVISLNAFGIIPFDFLKSFILAGIITYLNFALGFLSITIGLGKPNNFFLFAVFGGMVLRLFLMVLMVFISVKFLDIRVGVFIFVILFFYIIYLIIEIFYLFIKKGSI